MILLSIFKNQEVKNKKNTVYGFFTMEGRWPKKENALGSDP
jgi:hypothetical protein